MSDHETETTDAPQEDTGVASTPTREGEQERDEALAPAEDADNPGLVSDEQHESTATDLPEGATIDPLTDQRPEPVVEQETHDD